jgi:hypothetical protein
MPEVLRVKEWSFLPRLVFQNCVLGIKSLIEFVVADRTRTRNKRFA